MDFDLLVQPGMENARRIIAALEDFGFGNTGISEDAFQKPGAAITLGAQPNQIDLLTSMSTQPTQDILSHAETVRIKNIMMKVVSYQDLLFAKQETGRAKDRIDYEELKKLPPEDR